MVFPAPWRYSDLLRGRIGRTPGRIALAGVTFGVHCGERLALVGPNGAGKTTLLKLIAGLLHPTTGNVTVQGWDTVEAAVEARRFTSIMVNEERSTYWRLSARQNLEFFGCLDEIPSDVLAHRIDAILRIVGLSESADIRVGAYSSGMRQRLSLARALLPDPELVLLDEPTRSLDVVGAEAMRGLIAQTAENGLHPRTVILATNNLEDVASTCDLVRFVGHREVSLPIDVRGLGLQELRSLHALHLERE